MTVPTCAHCPTPLTDRQGVYCSYACRYAARAVPERPCAGCGRTFLPSRGAARYCSRRCVQQHQRRPQRHLLLSILHANQHTWMSLSDLAIWLHGDDGPWECRAIRTLLYRLRHDDGFTISSRLAPWDARPNGGPARAYRLIADAQRRAA